MGIFSWFSTTANKSNAAALIQSTFEVLAKGGILESQPASLANRVVEAAFTRVPNLANTKYNKYVLAVTTLGMVHALHSFSQNEREASKHALGMMLKYVLELEMTNSLALTLSERETVERAQQLFLQISQANPAINLGPLPGITPASGLGQEQSSSLPYAKSLDGIFTEDEIRKLRVVSISMGKKAGLQGFVDFTSVGSSAAAASIGLITDGGDSVAFGSLVKALEANGSTVSARGLGGNRLPEAPELFEDVDTAIEFMQPYLDFMSTKASAALK